MLRLCFDTDCHDIWRINKEEMGYNVPFETAKKQLEKLLRDPSHRIYVYECDHHVVGYVHACNYDLLYQPPMKNIMGIAVLKDYRRNGIGGLLLLMVEDWASDSGAYGVRLSTGKMREEAHKFYEAWGYECTKEQLNYVKMLED